MILRACICIPTYNNPETINQVVMDCLKETILPILIIDDGSTIPVEKILTKRHDRLTTIRIEKNSGKGFALQLAINHLIKNGFTHMITMDGDSQHCAQDLPRLILKMKEFPWDLIIASRKFEDCENVPPISKFGRNFSNFWAQYQTESTLQDTQSGFRIYPLFHLQNMKFFTKRFDFEIEILIRLLWNGVSTKEVDTSVHYPPPDQRVSHFRKFHDNVRISFLNVILVIITLFKSGLTPLKIAASLGIGAFVGCTPFWGFHSLIIIPVSLFTRLNILLLWIGTQISIPPLAPFLVFFSLYFGHLLLKKPFALELSQISINHVSEMFGTYLIGSLIVGIVSGWLIFLVSLFFASKIIKKDKQTWTGKVRGGRFGNWFLVQVIRFLGLRWAYFCLLFIAPYFLLFAPKASKSSYQLMKMVFPNDHFIKLLYKVILNFYTFGTVLMDRIYQSFHEKLKFITLSQGEEHIISPLQNKQPLILITAHMGAWDMATIYLKQFELLNKFSMVKYEGEGITFEKIKQTNSSENSKQIISNNLDLPIFEIKDMLEAGACIGMMADRPIGQNLEIIPFRGKLILLDSTPFVIANICKTQIGYAFTLKGKENNYHFTCLPHRTGILKLKSEKHYQNMLEFSSILEKMVQDHPYQWFNFFCLWEDFERGKSNHTANRKQKVYLLEELNIPNEH